MTGDKGKTMRGTRGCIVDFLMAFPLIPALMFITLLAFIYVAGSTFGMHTFVRIWNTDVPYIVRFWAHQHELLCNWKNSPCVLIKGLQQAECLSLRHCFILTCMRHICLLHLELRNLMRSADTEAERSNTMVSSTIAPWFSTGGRVRCNGPLVGWIKSICYWRRTLCLFWKKIL